MLNVNIREASSSDIDVLAQHNQAMAKETENITLDSDTLLSGVANALNREDCHYFVAEIKEDVVGQAMITYEWSDWRNGVMWWIQSVYVRPEYRKQGIFSAIFKYIEDLANNDPEVKALRLYVMKGNEPGKNTYTALGMQDSGYIVYEKEGLD